MNRNRFKVGTFNLCNLVLPDVLYYRKKIYTQTEYALKTTWIAEQLKKMKADIVGFQEVFHKEALQQALAQSQVYDNATTVFANPTGKSPVVALTSRFPVLEYNVIKDFPTTACLDIQGTDIPLKRFSRPVLEAHLKLSDTIDCTVFVIHLKSKRPIIPDGVDRNDPIEQAKGQARSLILRAAEATALRVILMDKLQHRDHPVIVMGDVNDSGLAITSQIVSGEPPLRKLWFQQKQIIWDVLLYYVKDIQARQNYGDFYYTHIHNGHHESLDHILVSQEFVVQNPKRIGRVGYVSLFNDHLIDETLSEEKIETWQSDHGQVVVSIELDS
ncbi:MULTISPECIES: endonuclease/exonuclease/phosphatase family protein [Moorena]|uniref:Putative extracellular nuclease n=1 Tax=Moorena producens 3L TaxID=489825 RepID=F4XJY8_9CYAN|nr:MULTISPECIES: endonuclease/exonuclease/phosphatase family protein [Moorena]NES81204.1 endonuclease/exonuclease/phosphatase family protein [Moorena sp. SIO2B7]EGJ34947.1 putative extracellular nuclease [Moorena producens 3L]NEP33657.1 endonuclease/exonuclease/phosphatase family protein [Moorena sp. SIO3B2]NEP67645.1 endonuclease/exonuclease/phosphatase family protein [Moorena sp. SIO3A5]NER86975.1 endonuclease/exonuclease/phosphatase family protein [Moorena sp. SIO3A2]